MLNDTWIFISAWYNLPFTLLLIRCIFLALLQLLGLGGDGDSNADLDSDLDLDADADLDGDLDIDGDGDLDHDFDPSGSDFSNVLSALAFLGVGKAPLMVVLLLLFGSVGLLGWIFNSLVQNSLGYYPALAFALILPLSLILGGLFSSRTARFIGRALPPISTTASHAAALVGRRGTVISPAVDQKYGLVRLRDAGGTLINIFATTDTNPIQRDQEVILLAYDREKRQYTVTAIESNHS